MPAVDICVAHVYNQIHAFFLLDYLDLFSHNTTVSQEITKRQIWLFLGTFRKPNTKNQVQLTYFMGIDMLDF